MGKSALHKEPKRFVEVSTLHLKQQYLENQRGIGGNLPYCILAIALRCRNVNSPMVAYTHIDQGNLEATDEHVDTERGWGIALPGTVEHLAVD